MASFLTRFTTAKIQPARGSVSEPAGADARALQAKLSAALSEIQPSPGSDADLLALYRRYREARKDMHKVFAERTSSDAEADQIMGRCDALLKDIAKMQARTLRGFGAKMDALRSCKCPVLEQACPQESDAMLLQSIVADSYWLFGAGDAIVSEGTEENEAEDDPSPEAHIQCAGSRP